ncbi:MAG: FtsX-like permease family protein [Betaproteobacteria bacterium]
MTRNVVPTRGAQWGLLHAMVLAPLRHDPGRLAVATFAIALGVALGVAVHLINASAVNEFRTAARHLSGVADLVVRGPRAGFDEALYPQLARLAGVEALNPALEIDVQLSGRSEAIRILAFDPMRAARVQPSLLPERTGMLSELLGADAVLLSPAAAQWLGLKPGDDLHLAAGSTSVPFRIVGLLPHEAYRQRLAVMDIATAQWRLARLGRLNRIDVKLSQGVSAAAFQRELQRSLPPGVHAATPDDEARRTAELSRAYRANLDMLALIALFTGAFLVFSSQALAVLRRRAQLALLRALGVTRSSLTAMLLAEGIVVGALGAACGVALGYLLARHAVAVVGADLGAGYFRTVATQVTADPVALLGFFGLGVAFAAVGAAVPAWEAARRPPAPALHAGDEEAQRSGFPARRWGIAALVLAAPCAFLPAMDGLPVGGYLAITLILLGGVLLTPSIGAACLARLPVPRGGPAAIAGAQIRGTPRQAAISIAAIVISMSLMVSMLIMVVSFRHSLDAWLERMLPADLYLRAGTSGETAFLSVEEQSRIAATPGVRRAEFLRSQSLLLDPSRPPVTLLARPVDAADAGKTLPLSGPAATPAPGAPPPVWVSEVAADLYGFRVGDRARLALDGIERPFFVAGIWRDYARQNGAIVIERERYIGLTGDRLVNDAALWLESGASLPEVRRAIRDRLGRGTNVEISATREVRQASLAIFDRTFAITYALEAAAILIGLLGVSLSFSAQAVARRREFGVLRHLGMTRREIGVMLGLEGAVVTALGAALGVAVGWVISLILIHVVNRQSFHWTLDMHMPWLPVGALALLIVACAALTACWSARAAMRDDVVRAVREDW